MAIKRIRTATYVADTGKEFEVTEMTASHLLNAIGHHLKQIESLDFIERYASPPHHLLKRKEGLLETIQILAEELQTRSPDMDDDHREKYVNKKWEDRSGY
jgi:hypothetical protein